MVIIAHSDVYGIEGLDAANRAVPALLRAASMPRNLEAWTKQKESAESYSKVTCPTSARSPRLPARRR